MAETAGKRSASDILEIFARLESNRSPGRNPNFLAGPWVTADSPLPWLHLEYPEAPQLDTFATLHGDPHRLEYRIHRHLGLDLGDVGDFRDFVDDVDLNHEPSLADDCNYYKDSDLACQTSR